MVYYEETIRCHYFITTHLVSLSVYSALSMSSSLSLYSSKHHSLYVSITLHLSPHLNIPLYISITLHLSLCLCFFLYFSIYLLVNSTEVSLSNFWISLRCTLSTFWNRTPTSLGEGGHWGPRHRDLRPAPLRGGRHHRGHRCGDAPGGVHHGGHPPAGHGARQTPADAPGHHPANRTQLSRGHQCEDTVCVRVCI